MAQVWTEHETCARCGSKLEDDFRANHLGVRFCTPCYAEAIEAKAEERNDTPWVREICNRCGGSLINGYSTNYMGVLFCTDCFERTHTSDGRPRPDWEERGLLSVAQARRRDEAEDLGPDRDEEEGTLFLHDVFFLTTVLALVMYALSRFGGVLLTLVD